MNGTSLNAGGFVEQNLLHYLSKGVNPEVAIERVSAQLQTGDVETDLSISEQVQNTWETITSQAESILAESISAVRGATLMSFGNRTFKIIG